MVAYPEHEKAKEVKLIGVQEIGYFLDRLIGSGALKIPAYYVRRGYNIEKLIQLYFKIDHQKLMAEKEQMLSELTTP